MTLKQYNLIRIAMLIATFIVLGWAVFQRTYLLVGGALALFALLSYLDISLRKKVPETVPDEREHYVTGQAANLAIWVYIGISMATALALYMIDPSYARIAQIQASSMLLLMYIFGLAYRFKNNPKLNATMIFHLIFLLIYFAYVFIPGFFRL